MNASCTSKRDNEEMCFHLSYCPGGPETLRRLQCLYGQRYQDIVLASMQLPSAVLREFAKNHPPGHCEYPDISERVSFWDSYLRERTAIRDDSVPSAYLSEMDQGLYAGLLGGSVQFMCDPDSGHISSMVAPNIARLVGI